VGSKVFISCGQATEKERAVADKVAALLSDRGFSPYVAVNVQNLFEINSSIINELKESDCYLFINFRREKLKDGHRGSLFSNQEFAIAFALGFEKLIVVNQVDVKPDGILRYFGCNTKAFKTCKECISSVTSALEVADWHPGYSRNLIATETRIVEAEYQHFTGELMQGTFVDLDLENRRPDKAALETSLRFVGFRRPEAADWTKRSNMHRSVLKASGRSAYSHTIFPGSSETFSLLFAGTLTTGNIPTRGTYLVSAMDAIPCTPLEMDTGEWELLYQYTAVGFPTRYVEVEITLEETSLKNPRLKSQYSAQKSSA